MAAQQDQDRKPQERIVTIDVETATETVTQPEDVERVRREAGIEDGTPPPRGEEPGASSREDVPADAADADERP